MSEPTATIPQFAEIAQLLGTSPAGRSDAGEGGPVMAKPTPPAVVWQTYPSPSASPRSPPSLRSPTSLPA